MIVLFCMAHLNRFLRVMAPYKLLLLLLLLLISLPVHMDQVHSLVAPNKSLVHAGKVSCDTAHDTPVTT